MYFENRFPESGSGQILHPVRAGQNILDLIRRPRIATILLCVDHAADPSSEKSRPAETDIKEQIKHLLDAKQA